MTHDKTEQLQQRIIDLEAEVNSLRTVISKMPGNVYWKNNEGFFLGCNDNVATVLKLKSPEDIIGKTNRETIGEELAEVTDEIDSNVIKNGQEFCLEENGINSNGTPAIYLTRKTPLYDRDGQIQGLLGISFDITERKQIEEKLKIAKKKAETANRAKSRFLAMISHELRTPLTSILGFANLLSSTDIASELRLQFVNHICNSGNYLLSLINSLLDYNKLETNKFEYVALPLNLKKLLQNEVDILNGAAQQKNLKMSLEYDENVPKEIMSNARILRQIFVNLIGNAIKFTEHGSITISVSSLKSTKDNVTLQFSVQDTGPGIPIGEQKFIFKRFYQLGNVYTRNTSLTGTGLGLAIVKKLVKILGGVINVKSIPQQGSTFSFKATFKTVTVLDSPWLPYADHVKILAVQDHSKTVDFNFLLANTYFEICKPNEMLDYLFAAQRSMQPFDILILDCEHPQELWKQILAEYNIHNPVSIGINSNNQANEPEFFASISNPLALQSTREFQFYLSTIWQEWKAHEKDMVQKIPLTKEPYVLLVEDNELIQIIHKNMLIDIGCKVDVSSSAIDTLKLISNNYDLLFIDIGLPDIAGFELIKTIRSQHHNKPQIPIIVLTGYSEEEERQYCIKAGANEVAIKPVSKETLNKILRHYIKPENSSLALKQET